MAVVVISNLKRGVGKSTLATGVAGYFASQGHVVVLRGADRQEPLRLCSGLRPPAAKRIASWPMTADKIWRPAG